MAPPKTPNALRGTIRGTISQNIATFTIRASPLPSLILEFILENLVTLKKLQQDRRQAEKVDVPDVEDEEGVDIHGDIIRKPNVAPAQFWESLQAKFREAGGEWDNIVDKIWAFGPQGAGGCVLIDSRTSTTWHNSCVSILSLLLYFLTSYGPNSACRLKRRLEANRTEESGNDGTDKVIRAFDNSIETAFQMATFQGPLCAEPVEGMAYFVESVEIDRESLDKEIGPCLRLGFHRRDFV